MIDDIQTLHVLLGATALLAAAATVSIVRFQRKFSDLAVFWNSPIGAAVQADTGERESYHSQLAAELAELRKVVESLSAAKPASEPVKAPESTMGSAVMLVKQGASAKDLAQCCGLNAGEAQLLVRLHGPRSKLTDVA